MGYCEMLVKGLSHTNTHKVGCLLLVSAFALKFQQPVALYFGSVKLLSHSYSNSHLELQAITCIDCTISIYSQQMEKFKRRRKHWKTHQFVCLSFEMSIQLHMIKKKKSDPQTENQGNKSSFL